MNNFDDDFDVNVTIDLDEDDNVEFSDRLRKKSRASKWYRFPYPMVATLIFLCLGFFADLWNPGWLIFLTIPMYYQIVTCAVKGTLKVFPYTSLCILIYLGLGLILNDSVPNIWIWALLVFATIPLYSFFIKKRNIWKNFPFATLCVIVYIVLGVTTGAWHPAWLIFLTIPIYDSLVKMFRN